MAKRFVIAICLAVSLASAFAVMGPGIDWCAQDWVKESAFWSWYFNCPDNPTPAPQ